MKGKSLLNIKLNGEVSDYINNIIKEIVSAFESYYSMKFDCSVSKRKFEDEWIFDLEICKG